jgi:threonine/homoserine/homoserine lactone efflux protein
MTAFAPSYSQTLAHGARAAMTSLELLIRGAICGVIIAAPVGPVNVICVQRTITKGWRSGLISGFGSMLADSVYGAIAGFSVSFVIGWLIREQFWIRLFGGMLLIGIGLWYFRREPASIKEEREESEQSDWVSTFLLTATNPTTVLSFMAVQAVLGLAESRPAWMTLFVVLGIAAGTMLWWFGLTGVVNHFRDRVTDRFMFWMNRAGGAAICLFGVITLILSHRSPRP